MTLGELYTASNYGTKSSATDAGTIEQVAWDNDYVYICTATGVAGHATWKRCKLMKAA